MGHSLQFLYLGTRTDILVYLHYTFNIVFIFICLNAFWSWYIATRLYMLSKRVNIIE